MASDEKETKDRFGRVFRLKADLRQKHFAEWNAAYMQMPRVGIAQQRQAALQAAIVAGWIESPETAVKREADLATGAETTRYLFDGTEVGELKGAECNYYGKICDDRFEEEYALPNG